MASLEENNTLEELKELTLPQSILKLKVAKQFVESRKHLDVLKKALADNTSTSFSIKKSLDVRDYQWNEFGIDASNTQIPYCGCDKYCNEISWEDVQEYFNWAMLDKYITYAITSNKPLKIQYNDVMSAVAVMDWEDTVKLCKNIIKKIEKSMNSKILGAYANYVYVPNISMLTPEFSRVLKSDKKDIFGLDEKELAIDSKDLKGVAKYHAVIMSEYGYHVQFGVDIYTNKIVFDVVDKKEKQQFADFVKYCLKNKKTVKDVFNALRNSTLAQKAKEEQSSIPLNKKEVSVVSSAEEVLRLLASENNNIVIIQNILDKQLKHCAQQTLVGVASKGLPNYVVKALSLYCTKHKNIVVVINNFNVDINMIVNSIDGNSINTIKFNNCTLFNYSKLKGSTLEISESECLHSK